MAMCIVSSFGYKLEWLCLVNLVITILLKNSCRCPYVSQIFTFIHIYICVYIYLVKYHGNCGNDDDRDAFNKKKKVLPCTNLNLNHLLVCAMLDDGPYCVG